MDWLEKMAAFALFCIGLSALAMTAYLGTVIF